MQEDNELRLVPGDELRLRYSGDAAHPAWQSVGHVVGIFPSSLMLSLEQKKEITSKVTLLLKLENSEMPENI